MLLIFSQSHRVLFFRDSDAVLLLPVSFLPLSFTHSTYTHPQTHMDSHSTHNNIHTDTHTHRQTHSYVPALSTHFTLHQPNLIFWALGQLFSPSGTLFPKSAYFLNYSSFKFHINYWRVYEYFPDHTNLKQNKSFSLFLTYFYGCTYHIAL